MSKKIAILLALVFIAMPSFAKGLKIEKHYKLMPDKVADAYHPVISSDGSKILFTSDDYLGLKLLNLKNGNITGISEEIGSGDSPVFSDNNNSIYYKTNVVANRLRVRNVECYNIKSGKIEKVVNNTRDDIRLIDQKGNAVIKTNAKTIKKNTDNGVYAYSGMKYITVNVNGKETTINPVPDAHSYLWVSVSPDNRKILFVEPFNGIYTCDLNGENLKNYGRGSTPVWFGNDFIIAARMKDDGYVITSSQLYAINTETMASIALTTVEQNAIEATASYDAKKVVYTTEKGELFAIELNVVE